MPRWPDELTDCTIFLYETLVDAEKGESFGGSGFLVGVRWEANPKLSHIYAVTNYHVAMGGRASVIRLNTKKGKTACIETDPSEWFHIHGHDLAVYRIDGSKHFRADSIFDYKFPGFWEIELTDAVLQKFNLGIGDEVVSVGRFIDLSEVQRNEPLVRSGILASSQILPVPQSTDMQAQWSHEPSYVVEMRSRTGFSGSPVYIYIAPFFPRMVRAEDRNSVSSGFHGPWLLGVQWGQLPMAGPGAKDQPPGSSAVLAVVPCSVLSKLLLEDKRVIEERREYEARWEKGPHAVAESEGKAPPTKAENPQHKEDFNRLLDAALTGPQSKDQT